MGIGNFVAGMGNVAYGMEDMAGKMQDRQLKAQAAERNASMIRDQQRAEADNQQMAEMNRRFAEQMRGLSTPTQAGGYNVQSHGAAPEAPTEPPPVTSGYRNEGHSVPAPRANYDEDIKTYEAGLKTARSSLAAIDAARAPRPAGPTVDDGAGGVYTPETGRRWTMTPEESAQYRDLQQQATGYETGLKRFQELKRKGDAAAKAPVASGNVDMERIGSIMSMFPQRSPAVTPELIAAIKGVENKSGDPNAVSPKGAFGVMQTMPGTFQEMSKRYFEGKLDPKNAQHQEMAGVAYLNHLATVELPRRGIEPTPQNIASAYQQGPAGLSRNGISPGVTDGITNNASYTNKVMAGMGGQPQAAPTQLPQQQAAAPQQAAAQPSIQGQFNTVSGTNYDPQGQQRQMMQQYLTSVINVSRNPQIQQQAMQQLMGLKLQDADAQIARVGQAAYAGNPQAVQQLLSMFAGEGNQLGIAPTNDGRVAVVNGQGQVLEVFQDQQALTNTLVTKLSVGLREQAAASNAKMAEKFALSRADAAGKAPFEQALEAVKGNAALQKQLIESDGQIRKELVHQILQGQQMGRGISDNMGNVWAYSNDGKNVMHMGAPTVTNGVTSQPQVRQMPGLQVPAGRG